MIQSALLKVNSIEFAYVQPNGGVNILILGSILEKLNLVCFSEFKLV